MYETKMFVNFQNQMAPQKPIRKEVPVTIDLKAVDALRPGFEGTTENGTIVTLTAIEFHLIDEYSEINKYVKELSVGG